MRHSITEHNDSLRVGVCSVCGTIDYHLRTRPGGRLQRTCGNKRREHRKTWNANRAAAGKRWGQDLRHGMTPAEIQALKAAQANLCAICGRLAPLVVDHDHSCHPGDEGCLDCVRGALCYPCNSGLGMFQDDPKRLASAIRYLAAT